MFPLVEGMSEIWDQILKIFWRVFKIHFPQQILTRHGMEYSWHAMTRQNMAWHGMPKYGMARGAMTWHGMAQGHPELSQRDPN